MIRVRRALVSVHDKTGVVDFGRALAAAGVEILSTGGTAKALAEAGVPVRQVSDFTGFPECLDGRVKTLHPLVHGGLLMRRDVPGHLRQAEAVGIEPIDLVAVNLYPFEATVERAGATRAEAVEQVDVGGPAMLRSAAKNHAHVVVLVDPADYAEVLGQLEGGGVDECTAARLAAKAFARTAAYDSVIAAWLAADRGDAFPAPEGAAFVSLPGRAHSALRYGENSHQRAGAWTVPGELGGVLQARLVQGKQLSYNNVVDLDAAWTCARDLRAHGVAIVKHANPCGAAEAASAVEALQLARACDPVSAFGGVFAFNSQVDEAAAASVLEGFVECVIAPSYAQGALSAFAAKENVRILEGDLPAARRPGHEWKRVTGGFLVQDWDDGEDDPSKWTVVTRRRPTPEETRALEFAWRVVRHVKSNVILFAGPGRTLGVGAGQMSRLDSAEIAVLKAARSGLSLAGSVVASDAFFPFRDGLDAVARAGAVAVVQPGGSRRDADVIGAAEEHGVAMAFTGVRHFRH